MEPKLSYIICAVQRSGSFLLCESLKNTGLAGLPEEYFLPEEGWEDGKWARKHGVASRRDYLRLVFEKGTTPNGVFGTKIMWNYFPVMCQKLRELPEYKGKRSCRLMTRLFPEVRYIWIVRQDKIRQAVSWAKAAQTNIYSWHTGENPIPSQEPTFDFTLIDNLYKLILEGEAGWQRFFARCRVQPFRVVYEELVSNYEQTALNILKYLDIPYPRNLIFQERRLQKQADAVSEDWVEKYRMMKESQGSYT